MTAPSLLENLDREELARIFEAHFSRSTKVVAIEDLGPLQGMPGMSGDKALFAIMLKLADQDMIRVDCCAKRMNKPGMQEACHYRYLQERGFPVARFYGHYLDESDREVVVLEYLPKIGIDWASVGAMRRWISLIARLNATTVDDDYRPSLDESEWGNWLINSMETDHERVLKHAIPGHLGSELQSVCIAHESEVRSLAGFARRVHKVVMEMPRSLGNHELSPGWREDGTLVGFDLHGTIWAPRCNDMVAYLGEPGDFRASWGQNLSPRRDWAEFYAQRLLDAGGPEIHVDDILQETYILWLGGALQFGWGVHAAMTGEIPWPHTPDENKRIMRQAMLGQLESLLHAQMHSQRIGI